MTPRTRSSSSRMTSSPRSTHPGPFASTAASWSSSRSTARTVLAVAGLFGCRIQPRVRTPMPVWNPDLPTTEDFRSQWEQIPDNAEFTNGFRAQWEQFLSDVDAGRATRLRSRRRRTRPAAGRCRPEILGRGSPGRDRPVRVMTTTTATVALPEAGGGWREIELRRTARLGRASAGLPEPDRLCRRARRRRPTRRERARCAGR